MRVILTNDDGIAAPGLAALAEACRNWCEPVIVAPDRCHSSMSHHVQTSADITVKRLDAARFQVEGSPADCARLACTAIACDAEWLLSGINRGGNLGVDTCYSGTVAAAREAALLGLRAIAISHYVARGQQPNWEIAVERTARVLKRLMTETLRPGEFWNVNLPHSADAAEPEITFCPLDPSPLPVRFHNEGEIYRYSGDYQSRTRLPGHDVSLCFTGAITVTRLSATGGF